MGRRMLLAALPLVLAGTPAAHADAFDVPRLSYAARVTPSGLLVASTRLAVDGREVRALELRIPVGAGGLHDLEVEVGTASYAQVASGAPERPRTFVVVQDGDVAHVRIALEASPEELEIALSYHVPGLVRAGAAGALVRAEVPVPAGGAVDRLSASFGAGYGDEHLLLSARALGAELDRFDGAEAFLSMRGLGPGEAIALEAALVPGAVATSGGDATPLVPDALPAWASAPPHVVDDDEEALALPAPAPTLDAGVAVPPLTAPIELDEPDAAEHGGGAGRAAGAGLVAGVVALAVGLGRRRRRLGRAVAGPQPVPSAPPAPVVPERPVTPPPGQAEPTAPTTRKD